MKHEAEFVKDPSGNKLHVTREFNAPVEKVWKAWTTAELLDKWWAPKPYINKTKLLEFSEGGRWLYSMTSPEGEVHWCLLDFESIEPEKSFSGVDAFCDEDANINEQFPGSHWFNQFEATTGGTKVKMLITYKDEEAMKMIMEMGFKEGFTMGLDQLDEMLAKA